MKEIIYIIYYHIDNNKYIINIYIYILSLNPFSRNNFKF